MFLVFHIQPGKHYSQFYFWYCTIKPGPYSEFISEFSEFISSLVLKTRVFIVGDFNIHVDVDNDCLSAAFISLLDSIGFC